MAENPKAFSRPFSESKSEFYPAAPGMTLLDYFAGQALSGLLADPNVFAEEKTVGIAYKMAAAMLEERAKHI